MSHFKWVFDDLIKDLVKMNDFKKINERQARCLETKDEKSGGKNEVGVNVESSPLTPARNLFNSDSG